MRCLGVLLGTGVLEYNNYFIHPIMRTLIKNLPNVLTTITPIPKALSSAVTIADTIFRYKWPIVCSYGGMLALAQFGAQRFGYNNLIPMINSIDKATFQPLLIMFKPGEKFFDWAIYKANEMTEKGYNEVVVIDESNLQQMEDFWVKNIISAKKPDSAKNPASVELPFKYWRPKMNCTAQILAAKNEAKSSNEITF